MALAAGLAFGVWGWASRKFTYRGTAEQLMTEPSGINRILSHKYYVNEFYDRLIVKPLYRFSSAIYRFIENDTINGIVNGTGKVVSWSGRQTRLVQTGNIGFYLFAMVLAIILL